jgi:hypothetical protein
VRRQGKTLRSMVIGYALAAILLWDGSAWAKGRSAGPTLWIAADRIVGFVPFTVYLYGKIQGTDPRLIELCRSEAPRLTDSPGPRPSRDELAAPMDAMSSPVAVGPSCASGKVVRTPAGYDYSHDLRFDRPGTYHVRLSVIDGGGHRAVSNIVQVNAL